MADPARFNEPPQTTRERLIVEGILLKIGLTTLDPDDGVSMEPEAPTPYYYETKRHEILAGCAICILIMAVVTLTRLYLRWTSPRLRWGPDDWLMIPSLIMALAYPAIQMGMVTHGGAGQHMYDVSYQQYYIYSWLAPVAQIDFFVCVGFVKMSIAVFNTRLTSMSTKKSWKIGNWLFLALTAAYILIAFFINIFKCLPAAASFDLISITEYGEEPTCISVSLMNTILRVINIILDFCLLALPIVIVMSLQMSLRKKLRICVLFGFGALACVGSVMALVAKGSLKTDAMWNYTTLLAWTLVELTFGVITASLPTVAFLLPGGADTTKDKTASAFSKNISHTRDTFRERTRAATTSKNDEVIVRQDEIELTSTEASEADWDSLRQSRVPYAQKRVTYERSLTRNDGTQPGQYGPLEPHAR